MKYWIATPSAALGMASYLLAADRADTASCVKFAAAKAQVMSDACSYAVADQIAQCTVTTQSHAAQPRTLNWPGDFVSMTFDTAIQAWTGAAALLAYVYETAQAIGQAII